MNTTRFAEVAVSGPLRRTFSYIVPEILGELYPGQRLLVPLGSTRTVGFYLGPARAISGIRMKSIAAVIDQRSLIKDDLFQFCRWLADYYFANPADVLAAALPPELRGRKAIKYSWSDTVPDFLSVDFIAKIKPGKSISAEIIKSLRKDKLLWRRLISGDYLNEQWDSVFTGRPGKIVGYSARADNWGAHFTRRRFNPDRFVGTCSRSGLLDNGWSNYQIDQAVKGGALVPVREEPVDRIQEFVKPRHDVKHIPLNDQQRDAVTEMITRLNSGFSTTLLHGITGSGKTLVYCHVARKVVEAGRSVLILTPEIALSGQMLSYCRGFFGDKVTVVHSAMSGRERMESFAGIRSSKYPVVIGPRSALLAPLDDVGLIIVDEEHDASYKQTDPSPRFHGRDAAIMRAKQSRIPVLLGTASPSMESYQNVKMDRYHLLKLSTRPSGASLPTVRVVDMRTQRIKGEHYSFSFPLKKAIENQLEQSGQVILFLNRRGYSPQVKCQQCGFVHGCPNCRVNLTYHSHGNKLSCHHCGYVTIRPDNCQSCGSSELFNQGAGTQKIESDLPLLVPSARIIRLDSDTASGRARAFRILDEFENGNHNILLGTQMVTKGLDFPEVTLVGVLSADASLDLPDFRASERTFASLVQVAGRSGRAVRPGEVIIQTYYPENPLIDEAARQDYEGFFEREIESRRALKYPPFAHLVNFIISGKNEEKVQKATDTFSRTLKAKIKSTTLRAQVLGPAPCAFYFLKGQFRRHLFVKTKAVVKFIRELDQWEFESNRFGLPASVKIVVDVDPVDLL